MIRRAKSFKEVDKWNPKSVDVVNGPSFVDYTQLDDTDKQPQ